MTLLASILRAVGAGLLLVGAGAVDAQEAAPRPPAATLRLLQVVPQLPRVHFFALAQDARRVPTDLGGARVEARMRDGTVATTRGEEGGVAVVFLVDVSRSVRRSEAVLKAELGHWIEAMRPNDRAMLVTFGTNVQRISGFTGDKAALGRAAQALRFDGSETLLYEALSGGIDAARRTDTALPLRRAVVVLTDAHDDQESGAGVAEVLDRIATDPVPIYALTLAARRGDFARLSQLAHGSGGDARRLDGADGRVAYVEPRFVFGPTLHLIAACRACAADGSLLSTRLIASDGGQPIGTQSVAVHLALDGDAGDAGSVGSGQTVTPPAADQPWWRDLLRIIRVRADIAALLLGLAVAGGAVAYVIVRNRKTALKQADAGPPEGPAVAVVEERAVIVVAAAVQARAGVDEGRARLRILPIGRNDLDAMDALFDHALTLGRDVGCDVRIGNDGQVSTRHCTLTPEDDRILIEDAGSLNGTRINGVPITGPFHAESDSVLGVGRTELRLRLLAKDAL